MADKAQEKLINILKAHCIWIKFAKKPADDNDTSILYDRFNNQYYTPAEVDEPQAIAYINDDELDCFVRLVPHRELHDEDIKLHDEDEEWKFENDAMHNAAKIEKACNCKLDYIKSNASVGFYKVIFST